MSPYARRCPASASVSSLISNSMGTLLQRAVTHKILGGARQKLIVINDEALFSWVQLPNDR